MSTPRESSAYRDVPFAPARIRNGSRIFARSAVALMGRFLLVGSLCGAAAAARGLEVGPPVAEVRFGPTAPPGWQLTGEWSFSLGGAAAGTDARATSSLEVPSGCLVEMIFDLPPAEKFEQKVTTSISVGSTDDKAPRVTVSAVYQVVSGEKPSCPYSVSLSGTGFGGKPVSVHAKGDMRPSVLRAWEEAGDDAGWAGQTVSLGVTLEEGLCRLLVNGNVAAEIPVALPAERMLSVAASGITLRAVRVLPGVPRKYAFLGGAGLAMLSGGVDEKPATGMAPGRLESSVVEIDGVPFVLQGAGEGRLAALDVAAEKWKSKAWSEGTGMPVAPLPPRWYSAAYLLLHLEPKDGEMPSMGFGLRVPEMSGGELKNIYVGDVPVRSCDAGVTVRPIPELGEGWFLARVPINPAALVRLGSAAYFTRTWTTGGGTPRPVGNPSALSVAACTVEEAGIELSVDGNDLGNVYAQPAQPWLTAAVSNRTQQPVTVAMTVELIPFGRVRSTKEWKLSLSPGQVETFDALAAPIADRGHYRVRVVADAGSAGRIDYRTNVGILAPDLRMKINSPFGCWSTLWTDGSTPEQKRYLKVLAGIGFWMGPNHHRVRLDIDVPDDTKAEEIATSIGPDVRIFMLGWEQNWGIEQTFAFPRVIAEREPEHLSEELNQRIDKVAEQWRRLALAVRKHRPGLKISLGNSGVNFSVPFLERGFKPGVEFDYFGTEEGIFSSSPEQPATAIGNVNWWVKAICEHFGFQDVPIFHSESVYFSTGPGFTRMPERMQAGYYVRTYMLGFPYDSVFGFAGAMVDSANRYIYSIWGASGYCNQAPECSPKLSYVAYATLTQLLDGAKYDGRLTTGTTSVYALRFRRRDDSLIYAIWTLRGERQVTLQLKDMPKLQVVDAVHRPIPCSPNGDRVSLNISDLPVYVDGTEITGIELGPNVAQLLPQRTLLSSLEKFSDWEVDTEPDEPFEQPGRWTGVPKVMGSFDVSFQPGMAPPTTDGTGSITFTQGPLEGTHGLIPRYASLSAKPGKEIPIPRGTTRLGVWVHGNSTWAAVKIGVKDEQGQRRLLGRDAYSRMTDNFDGWRFLDTGPLDDADVQSGACSVDRIVVTMPEQQVYVDELLTTQKPEIAIWGLCTMDIRPPDVNYLPW